jgi:carbon-monoxide dehydrogenase medium subunit
MPGFRSIKQCEYKAPDSLTEALKILEERTEDCKVLAGGTDLILQMKQGLVNPSLVMDVKQVPELNTLEWSKDKGLRIGAAVPLSRLLAFPGLPKAYDILFEACCLIGSTQIKNRGSIGGNICNAASSADSAPPLLCLGAKAVLRSNKGKRTIPLDEFFVGPGKTALGIDELLLEIEIPTPVSPSAGCYLRHTTREEMDIAVVGVGCFLTPSAQGDQIESARLALGAVAPTPVRVPGAERLLEGNELTEGRIEQAAETAAETADPISDLRASSEYRRELVRVLTRRVLIKAGEELGLKL